MTADDGGHVRVDVLGATRVSRGAIEIHLTAGDVRVLTALAALQRPTVEQIEELAWSRKPSGRALAAAVYRLRQSLGRDSIVRDGDRIRLDRTQVAVDIDEFTDCLGRLGLSRVERATAALSLVHGSPFESMKKHRSWSELVQRWQGYVDENRDVVLDDQLRHGVFGAVIDGTVEQLQRYPTHEARVRRLVDALFRSGRRTDALRAVEGARRAFGAVGLGLPSEVEKLEAKLLAVADVVPDRSAVGGEPLVGRAALVSGIVRSFLDTDHLPSVVITGGRGLGKSAVLRAVVRRLAEAGIEVVWKFGDLAAGEGLDLQSMTLPLDGRPTVVAVDMSEPDEQRLAVLGELRRRLTGRCGLVVAADLDPSGYMRLFDREVPLAPLSSAAVTEWADAVAAPHPMALVMRCTGGVPGLISDLFERSELDAVDIDGFVRRRVALLPEAARELLLAAAMVVTRWDDDDLASAQFGVPVRSTLEMLRRYGWLADLAVEPLDDDLRPSVIAAADRDVLGTVARRLRSVAARRGTPVAMVEDANLAVLPGDITPHEAGQRLIRAFHLVDESDGRQQEFVAQLCRRVAAERHLVDAETEVRLKCAMVYALRTKGEFDAAARELQDAYRIGVGSGDPGLAAEAAIGDSFPPMYAVTNAGETGRRFVGRWLDDPRLDDRMRARVAAVHAFHVLARFDQAEGVRLAREAIGLAEGLDAETRMWVLHMTLPEIGSVRALSAEARELSRIGLEHGMLTRMSRGLVYELCADLRTRVTTFDDARRIELEAMSGGGAPLTVRLRTGTVLAVDAVLRADIPQAHAALVPLAEAGDGRVQFFPFALHAFHLLATLGMRPDWTSFTPAEVLPPTVDATLVGHDDQPVVDAVRATVSGAPTAVLTALRSITSPPTQWAPSALWPVRLPATVAAARWLGDRDVAAGLLDVLRPMAGTDLSMLPFIHVGPAESWLADLAEVAADSTAASALHGAAVDRLTALQARVLELA